jgi:hypothetical protein
VPGLGPLARFAAALALLLALFAATARGDQNGDFVEYAMMTVALASHASPAIRLADLAAAKPLLPNFAGPLAELEQGMRENRDVPKSGFYRGRERAVYAIHFFAYPALAALPFRMLQAAGAPPFKCFQLVNLALVFALGLAMYRLFGTGRKAMLGVAFFLLCGGGLYLKRREMPDRAAPRGRPAGAAVSLRGGAALSSCKPSPCGNIRDYHLIKLGFSCKHPTPSPSSFPATA